MQPGIVQRRERGFVSDHVGDRGDSRGDRTGGAVGSGRCPVVTGALVRLIEGVAPIVEAVVVPACHLVHVGVLQVRVRVDESGGEHTVPVLLAKWLAALGERFEHPAPVADVQNALAAHGDCAVFDARTGHRHHDVRTVDDDLWVHGFESMASPPWQPAPYAR